LTPRRIVIFGWAESVHARRWALGLQNRGCEVKLISLGGQPVDELDTTIFTRSGRMAYFRHAGAAAREARAFKPDLVHVHYAAGFGLWGLRMRFAPMVVSVWGSDILDLARKALYRPLVRRVLKQAKAITATSNYLNRETCSLYPPAANKITVIPFGVDTPEKVPDFPAFGPIRLCYLKMHRAVYGPDTLIEALSIVKQSLPDIQLSMAGSGEMTGQLKAMVDERGLNENVSFCGFIDHSRVMSFIAQHHFMVMPSLSESFGVAVLEAGACGRAAVSTRVGGIPEVVKDGETGILVPPGDVKALARAILTLAQDTDKCRRMGEASRVFVEKEYRWQRSLDLMSGLYDRIATARG
jgi:glycosyltransferase involved in cell wall biosynthesis